jgi:hypothetical protein
MAALVDESALRTSRWSRVGAGRSPDLDILAIQIASEPCFWHAHGLGLVDPGEFTSSHIIGPHTPCEAFFDFRLDRQGEMIPEP